MQSSEVDLNPCTGHKGRALGGAEMPDVLEVSEYVGMVARTTAGGLNRRRKVCRPVMLPSAPLRTPCLSQRAAAIQGMSDVAHSQVGKPWDANVNTT